MEMNVSSSQSVIRQKVHCPYCNKDDAVLISEVSSSKTSLQMPDYGMKYWLSVIFTFGVYVIIHGFPVWELKRVYKHNTYGFCPYCGNSYNASLPSAISHAERQKNMVYKNMSNKVFMGVCSGVSEFTGLPLKLVRLVMVLYALTIIPAIIYLIAGLLMDTRPERVI